jgi:hypothetical protein
MRIGTLPETVCPLAGLAIDQRDGERTVGAHWQSPPDLSRTSPLKPSPPGFLPPAGRSMQW